MKVQTLTEILTENPPIQFQYLQKLLNLFSQSEFLTSAFIRGSIARNDYDRTSDLDMVLAIDPSAYINVVESLNELMNENFVTLFKGWPDRIVPSFGGMGLVYLIECDSKILQIDLYILPSNRLEKLERTPSVKKIFEKQNVKLILEENDDEIDAYLISKFSEFPTLNELLIEVVILAFLIKKRINRNQVFLNYSETVLLNRTLRDIVRLIFDPKYKEYGWYHLKEILGRHSVSAKWCNEIEQIIITTSVHNMSSLIKSLEFAINLVREQAPEELSEIEVALDHFLIKMRED